MSAVLENLGLTAATVRRQVKGLGSRVESRKAMMPTTEPEAFGLGRVIPATQTQVGPVLSDEEVDRIAERIAGFLRGRMRLARRDMTQRKGPMRCPEKLAGVLQVVADHFGLSTTSVLGVSRVQPRARARQVFIWAATQRMDWTLSEAERELGIARGTIDHARNAVENMRDWSNPIGASVRECLEKVKGGE